MQKEPVRLCLIGWGAIATAVHTLLAARNARVRTVAIAVRNPMSLRSPPPPGSRIITDPSDLAATDCNLVVEAAGRSAAAVWGEAALRLGLDFVIGSPSVMANRVAAERLRVAAQEGQGRLVLPAGSLGGIGALASAARMSLEHVRHEIVKHPQAWRGTEAETRFDLSALVEPTLLFSGSAREAANRYPANANSVVVTALAGIGLDRTLVRLMADPSTRENEHRLEACGAFGHWSMVLKNTPLAENPKSSAMTALNLVRAIENCEAEVIL